MSSHNVSMVGANSVPTPKEAKWIPLEQINLSDDYRFRIQDNEKTIDEYTENYRQFLDDQVKEENIDYPFPTIYVLREGDTHCVIAGRLRFQAAQKAGLKEMPCNTALVLPPFALP